MDKLKTKAELYTPEELKQEFKTYVLEDIYDSNKEIRLERYFIGHTDQCNNHADSMRKPRYCCCGLGHTHAEKERESCFQPGEFDDINKPAHYNVGIQPIDFIESIPHLKGDYRLGNAIKYIARAGMKDPDTFYEDLRKAEWFIKRVLLED